MRALKADSADRMAPDSPKTTAPKPRRQKKERALPRRNRRRRLAVAGLALGLAALIGVSVFGYQQNWHGRALASLDRGLDDTHRALGLKLAQVTVEGRQRLGPDAMRQTLGIRLGDPILRLDLDDIRENLMAHGWVKDATVVRMLPDRLHIVVQERTPFARWQLNGRTALIDAEGDVILRSVGARYQHLPRLVGPTANERAAELFRILDGAPRLAALVKTASLVRERRWNIGLSNGMTVRLPEEAPEAAWIRFNEVDRRDGLLSRQLGLIDLREPDRIRVRALERTPEEDDAGKET